MSRARQCDRCKKLYLDYSIPADGRNVNCARLNEKQPISDNEKTKYTFDLCPDCMKSLCEFFGFIMEDVRMEEANND